MATQTPRVMASMRPSQKEQFENCVKFKGAF